MTAVARQVEAAELTRYDVGGVARSGVWLGLSVAAVTTIGIGLLASILLLSARVSAAAAVLPLAVCVLVAVSRFAGRPLLSWTGPAAGHATAELTGSARWRGPWPATSTRRHTAATPRLYVPPECGRPRLHECPDDPSIGLVVDQQARTVTTVFDVAGVDRFPLLDAEDRDGLIAGWGQALSILADTDDALSRLQILDRASHHPSDVDTSAADDNLARALDTLAVHRESRLALQWTFPRLDDVAIASLAVRCRGVTRCLVTARLVCRPLSTSELANDITAALRGRHGPDAFMSGPLSRRTAWTHVTVDDTAHRCFAVTGWPRTPVTADWLAPLLLAAPPGVTRTVAVHLQRVPPAAAQRIARTTRANAMLDQRDRLRLGMTSSAALDRAEATGAAMDDELAAGYRTHRVIGLVTVTANSNGRLDDATSAVRQAAAASRLELRPLHGQHDTALAATLPLCRVRPRGTA